MQWNKKCKTIRCAKTVYWDLINSNMNKRDVQTGCTGYVHIAAIHSNNNNHLSFSRGTLRAHTIIIFLYSLEVHLFDQIVFN